MKLLLMAALGIGLLAAAADVRAYDATNNVKLLGAGAQSCGTWTTLRRDRQDASSVQWVFGILSGIGAVTEGANPLHDVNSNGVRALDRQLLPS